MATQLTVVRDKKNNPTGYLYADENYSIEIGKEKFMHSGADIAKLLSLNLEDLRKEYRVCLVWVKTLSEEPTLTEKQKEILANSKGMINILKRLI